MMFEGGNVKFARKIEKKTTRDRAATWDYYQKIKVLTAVVILLLAEKAKSLFVSCLYVCIVSFLTVELKK